MNAEVSDLWKIVATGPRSVHELRAFHYQNKSNVKRQIFRAIDYNSVEEMKAAFEKRALELNDQGYNIYITMNPISPDFKGKSAADSDIDYRDLLLIDIDRTGDTSQPATDQEIENAKALADKIATFLGAVNWPEPIRVFSGNGWHMFYLLDDLGNDKKAKELIQRTLKCLAKRFNNIFVSVDTSVSNASRIFRVPGTMNRKGEESEDRPHRMAVML